MQGTVCVTNEEDNCRLCCVFGAPVVPVIVDRSLSIGQGSYVTLEDNGVFLTSRKRTQAQQNKTKNITFATISTFNCTMSPTTRTYM